MHRNPILIFIILLKYVLAFQPAMNVFKLALYFERLRIKDVKKIHGLKGIRKAFQYVSLGDLFVVRLKEGTNLNP